MGLKNLPVAATRKHIKAFERLGWNVESKTGGRNPHVIMTKPGHPITLAIPNHQGKDVPRALLKGLIVGAGETEESYLAAFRG